MSDEQLFEEKRKASPIGDTSGIPAGTMLTVPSSPPVGSTGSAPIVAANNRHWWEDPAFMAAATGALLAIADPVLEALTSSDPIRWRSFAAGCILALVAYFRKRTNSVLR